ncbi:hypothetical protein HN419_05175 [Candidatus Woesearchaeota archaeon]|jgi:hypothetical protein|nr:hypothetical protein [Candidatus Woesearchaeota archaeon]MBT3537737.1 hypothetical protein [Candidatus Woesearchaeota archaeon]MBT4697868.1 hypothetical protein [Candidatus Woesearchaeota archaeon]MBT4717472.1 hypothetical protein [Candidatus Woesearchaeota archaeon]MBT7105406.1 hypothetical protein [Candidatus Woesearchaeota archaeon]
MNPLEDLKKSISLLSSAVRFFKESPELMKAEKRDYSDFRLNKAEYYLNIIKQTPDRIKNALYKIDTDDSTTQGAVTKAIESANMLTRVCMAKNIELISKSLDDLASHISKFKLDSPTSSESQVVQFPINRIPAAIRGEIKADIDEMMRCFTSGCLRSTAILCGRILETALHRKYYDATGNDILATNPGIGLGKLIAKLKEMNVQFDPGITEQIHLINQVRIYSVHKAQQPFVPSKNQAHAMILYTLDVLKKLF